MKITVIKGGKRRTFKKVKSARKFAGKARNVVVIVTR